MTYSELTCDARRRIDWALSIETASWNKVDCDAPQSVFIKQFIQDLKDHFFKFKMAVLSEQDISQAFTEWTGYAIDEFRLDKINPHRLLIMDAYRNAERERQLAEA